LGIKLGWKLGGLTRGIKVKEGKLTKFLKIWVELSGRLGKPGLGGWGWEGIGGLGGISL